MYVKQSRQYQDNVNILTQRAEAAPESNSNLQWGYRDLRSNVTKLEENLISFSERFENIVSTSHLSSTYQQVCFTIDWVNEQLVNVEPKCALLYVEPEMSSHYFKTAETAEFYISSHQSPGFYKSIFLLRDQMKKNHTQD